jgi:hypothetical protein
LILCNDLDQITTRIRWLLGKLDWWEDCQVRIIYCSFGYKLILY